MTIMIMAIVANNNIKNINHNIIITIIIITSMINIRRMTTIMKMSTKKQSSPFPNVYILEMC